MNVTKYRILLAALCGVGMSVGSISTLQAREPSTSTLVSNVVPDVVNAYDLDGATAWVGLKECRALVSNDIDISVRFDTQIDTLPGDSSVSLFNGAVYYSLARGTTTNMECKAEDGCIGVPDADVTRTAEDITVGVGFRELTGLTGAAGCDAEIDEEYFIRIYLRNSQLVDTWQQAEGRIILDTIRPEPPTDISAVATPNSLRLEWTNSPSSDAARYVVVVSDSPLEGGELVDEEGSPRKSYPVTGGQDGKGSASVNLAANQVVHVAMAARDLNGNLSVLSPSVEVTTADTIDFWDYYRSEGGLEEGGCSVVGLHGTSGRAGSWPDYGWMVVLSGLVLRAGLRRRKS